MSTDVKENTQAGILDIDSQTIADILLKTEGSVGFTTDTAEPIIGEGIFDLAREALGVSKKEVQKVRNLDASFIAATAHLYGQGAIETMAANPHITQLAIEDIDMQGASASFVADRTRKPKDFLEVGYTARAGQAKGALARVRKNLAELAKETFSE